MKATTLLKLKRGDRVRIIAADYTVQSVTPKPADTVLVTFRDGSYMRGHKTNTVDVVEVIA